MRTILLTRGMPGSGKSTWIEKNNLEPYTLSSDKIRLLMQSPVTNCEGKLQITQKNDGKVWSLLMDLLEQRMSRGEFVVVDGTHYKAELLRRYKDLIDKYRYRAYIVDFTDVPLEVCIERNKQRDEYKFVPEEVLYKMSTVFEAEKNDKSCKEINNRFTILNPDKAIDILQDNLLFDFTNKYEKIVVFGDVHGCYEPLKQYFKKYPYNEKVKYIFTGDYLDRGIQNLEVLEFLSQIYDKPNVLLLEGNHEIHLKKYADKHYKHFEIEPEDKKVLKKYMSDRKIKSLFENNIRSREFLNHTIEQIESFDKSLLRQISRRFSQLAYFKFGDKNYLITHGGLPNYPSIFTSSEEIINGVGKYEDEEDVYKSWCDNTNGECVQIHAHRNIFEKPTKYDDYYYNLCDKPEFGGKVRIVEIYQNGIINEVSEVNNVYDENRAESPVILRKVKFESDNELLKALNVSKLVQRKVLGNGIISYNFTRDAFYKNKWNEITCKARGLFVDEETEKVVARGYDKFFLWGQTDGCKSEALKQRLQFPVNVYRKENGFLGLVSYNSKTDSLLVCSKSTDKGDFADMIREELEKLDPVTIENITSFSKEHNCTFIFECINQDKDPHIVEYNKNKLVLLDIVYNKFEDQYFDYSEVKYFAVKNNIDYKQLEYTFNTWDELYDWKHKVEKDYSCKHEGWVLQDANDFRVKLKTPFYNFWKYMRKIKDGMSKGSQTRPKFTSSQEITVFNFMRTIPLEELKSKSIIEIRKKFMETKPIDFL